MKLRIFFLALLCLLPGIGMVKAQDELAASLEVLSSGVEVLRVNTSNWLPVEVEAIVGVGDTIRTNATGSARITFFADGTDTELMPTTEYRIVEFAGDENSFNLSVEVLAGQTVQRLSKLLDANSSYDVNTPGMSMVARGTEFAVRVEANGRSGMLVSEGNVAASNPDADAEVPPGFGIRAAVDENLSDVVKARTFDELDAALDGCTAKLTTPDDVTINVRSGPSRDFPIIGGVTADTVTVLMGVTESSGWYRIAFEDGYGWILSSTAKVDDQCVGLRSFTDDFVEPNAAPSAESTPEATPAGNS